MCADGDMQPDVRPIVKRDHVPRPHPNATEAERLADVAFFGCAMNVNATVVQAEFCRSIPRNQITREMMASRFGASAPIISRVGARFFITVPAGKWSPNFPDTKSVPSDVR